MVERVERDVDIVTSAGAVGTPETAINEETGRAIGSVEVVTASGDIMGAPASVGADGLIVANGSGGAFNTTQPIVLQSGQWLIGGGTTIPVRGSVSGARTIFTAPGTRPTINGTVPGGAGICDQAVIEMAADTAVIGLNVNNLDQSVFFSNGVLANNAANFTVRNNNVTTKGVIGMAVAVNSSPNSMISDNSLSTSNAFAFGVYLSASIDAAVKGNYITTSGGTGMGVSMLSSNGSTVSGNTIMTSGSTAHGVFLSASDNNTVSGNIVTTTNASSTGIVINAASDNATGDQNTYNGAGTPCDDQGGTNNNVFVNGVKCN